MGELLVGGDGWYGNSWGFAPARVRHGNRTGGAPCHGKLHRQRGLGSTQLCGHGSNSGNSDGAWRGGAFRGARLEVDEGLVGGASNASR